MEDRTNGSRPEKEYTKPFALDAIVIKRTTIYDVKECSSDDLLIIDKIVIGFAIGLIISLLLSCLYRPLLILSIILLILSIILLISFTRILMIKIRSVKSNKESAISIVNYINEFTIEELNNLRSYSSDYDKRHVITSDSISDEIIELGYISSIVHCGSFYYKYRHLQTRVNNLRINEHEELKYAIKSTDELKILVFKLRIIEEVILHLIKEDIKNQAYESALGIINIKSDRSN